MNIWALIEEPRLVHAVAVHFPVALSVIGLPLMIAAALTKMRAALRQTVLGLYLLLAAAAFAATASGDAIQLRALTPAAAELVEAHAVFAPYAWMAAFATAVLVLLTFVRTEWFRAMFTVLAILTAAGTMAVVTLTAVRGHTMMRDQAFTAPPQPAQPPQPPPPEQATPPPAAPLDENIELEGLEPLELSADLPAISAEEALAEWRAGAPERASAAEPEQTYAQQAMKQLKRAKDWCQKTVWP